MITLSELQVKEVIVVTSGKRLGHISDLEIDGERGKITALVIAVKDKSAGLFGKPEEYVIPWQRIEVIGTDVILVQEGSTPSLYPDQPLLE